MALSFANITRNELRKTTSLPMRSRAHSGVQYEKNR
jgi:hypothetical protein